MKYNDYDVENFLTDPDFILWAKGEGGDQAYFFNKWLATNPENIKKAELAREMLNRLQCSHLEPTSEEFEEVLERILKTSHQKESRSSPWFPVYKLAAVFILLLLTLGAIQYYRVVYMDKFVVSSNPPGQKSVIILPDGSKVNLNADSQIKYPSDFGIHARNIELTGEAFFEVAHNDRMPFRVKSGSLRVEVLGTSFNLKNFNDKNIQISLLTGRLSVDQINSTNNEKILLRPGDRLTEVDGRLVMDNLIPDDVAWKSGTIHFKESSLAEVVETLERWYGVKIKIENQPADTWHYSGVFENYELAKILYRMSYTENFTFTIQGNHVKLTFLEDPN